MALALLIDPAQASVVIGEPYRPLLYRLAMLLAGLAAVVSLFALVRRRLGAVGLAVGMLVVLALTGVVRVHPARSLGAVVQPTLVVAAGAVAAVLLPERRAGIRSGVYLLALAVAAIMLGPAIWLGFDIGLSADRSVQCCWRCSSYWHFPLSRSPGHYLRTLCRDGKCALRRFRRWS